MNINAATLDAIFYNFDTRFQAVFAAMKRQTELVATEIPSGSRSTRYPYLDKIPRLREWLGPRVVQNVATRGYEIVNKDYELTVEVDRNDIEDDQIGVYGPVVDMIAQQSALWPDDLVIDAIRNGGSRLCHDGQYFFDTDHPVDIDNAGAGTQSNLATGTALTDNNLQAKITQMQQWKGRDGRSLRINPTHLVVGPDLYPTANRIVGMDLIATANPAGGGSANMMQSNLLRNVVTPVLMHELTDTGVWYLMDLSKPIKPIIFQRRKSPQFVSFTNPTDSTVFENKKFKYGVDSRGAAGYGVWFTALKASA